MPTTMGLPVASLPPSTAELSGILKKIEDEIKQQMSDAAEFAKESPEPAATELWTDILTQE